MSRNCAVARKENASNVAERKWGQSGDYSRLLVKAMSAEYRIESAGHRFTIIYAAGNQLGVDPTEEAAPGH